MPVYEFVCGEGHKTSDLFRMTERPNSVTCHVCGDRAIRIVSRLGYPKFSLTGGPKDSPFAAAHDTWFRSDETQQMLKDGEYERDPDPYGEEAAKCKSPTIPLDVMREAITEMEVVDA